MRKLLAFLLTIILFTSCQNKRDNESLDKALIQSLKIKNLKSWKSFFLQKLFINHWAMKYLKEAMQKLILF